MAKKKEVKSIFGNKKLQKINVDPVEPPDKRDYLEDFFEHEHSKANKPVHPKEEEEANPKIEGTEGAEESKVYKSYYAFTSSHNTFRDIVYTLRQKVDADLNNGEVFELMLQYYKQHVEKEHGALLKAKQPKRGRR